MLAASEWSTPASQCIALHCIVHCALYYIVLYNVHCIALHFSALYIVHCITLYGTHITLHCSLYYIVLHCLVLHTRSLHRIALHCIAVLCCIGQWQWPALPKPSIPFLSYCCMWSTIGRLLLHMIDYWLNIGAYR